MPTCNRRPAARAAWLAVALAAGAPAGAQRAPLYAEPRYTELAASFASPLPSGDPRNDTVWGRFVLPLGEGPVPGAVILHSLGNTRLTNELRIARALAERGIASLVIVLPYHMERLPEGNHEQQFLTTDLAQTRRRLRQAIADVQAALSWLQSRPEVDGDRLAIIGLSLGAVVGGAALGQDERAAAGVLLLGGGRLGQLIWHSFPFGSLRRAARREGVGPSGVDERWAEVDPAALADPEHRTDLLLINARYDWVVPRTAADALWEAWNRPHRVWVNSGHYGAGLFRRRLVEITADYLQWSLVDGGEGSPPLPHQPVGRAPKLQAVWLQNGGLRLGMGLELRHLDSDGDWGWDLGLTWSQLYTGFSYNLLRTGGSGYADLGLGYAIDRRGRTGLVVMTGFHF